MVVSLEILKSCQVAAGEIWFGTADATSSPELLCLSSTTRDGSLIQLAGLERVGTCFKTSLRLGGKVVTLLNVSSDLSVRVSFSWVGNGAAHDRGSSKSCYELGDVDHDYDRPDEGVECKVFKERLLRVQKCRWGRELDE